MAVSRVQASYAVIRYIPSILREEFINVGVILVCPKMQYQAVQALPSFSKSQGKMSVFDDADGRFVQHAITKLNHAATARRFDEFVGKSAAPDGLLTAQGLSELSRTYHNNIRLTEPRTLLTADPEASLRELYSMFIGVQEPEVTEVRVTRETMRNEVTRVFNSFDLFRRYPNRVQQKVKPFPWASRVDIAYKNGAMHYYQIVPFTNPDSAAKIVGNYLTVARDVRNPDVKPKDNSSEAEFAIFGHDAPEREHVSEIEAIKERLWRADIELLDYREDAPKVARQISSELDAHSGAMHVN